MAGLIVALLAVVVRCDCYSNSLMCPTILKFIDFTFVDVVSSTVVLRTSLMNRLWPFFSNLNPTLSGAPASIRYVHAARD